MSHENFAFVRCQFIESGAYLLVLRFAGQFSFVAEFSRQVRMFYQYTLPI